MPVHKAGRFPDPAIRSIASQAFSDFDESNNY
jgi:hypothetical protein